MKKVFTCLLFIFISFFGVKTAFAEFTVNGVNISGCEGCNIAQIKVTASDSGIVIEFTHEIVGYNINPFYIDSENNPGLYQRIKAEKAINLEFPSTALMKVTINGAYTGSLKTNSNSNVNIYANLDADNTLELLEGKYGDINANSGNVVITSGTYKSLILSQGSATINGGTFSGSSDYLLTNNKGNLIVNGGVFRDSDFLTNTSANANTIINDVDYSSSNNSKIIIVDSGEVTINGGTLKSEKYENSVYLKALSIGAIGRLYINGGTISTGNIIENNGVLHIGESGSNPANSFPTIIGLNVIYDGSQDFQFNSGIIYSTIERDFPPVSGYLIKSETETYNNKNYYKYYYEGLSKWQLFKSAFTSKANYSDILIGGDPIDLSVAILEYTNKLTANLYLNADQTPGSVARPLLLSEIRYASGITTYVDQLNDTTLAATGISSERNYNTYLLQTHAVKTMLYSLCDIYNYDPNIVIPWIENNSHTSLENDGIRYIKTTQSYDDGTGNTIQLSFVQELKIDLDNGLKNLPANAVIVNSTKKGDWDNNNAFNIMDVTLYRRYLAGKEERPSRRQNKAYEDFDNDTKALLNFDSNTKISLTDLINARIELANS